MSMQRQYDEDQHGTPAGAKSAAIERMRIEREHQRRRVMTTAEEAFGPEAVAESEFLRQAREYIALREELNDRGKTLVKELEKRSGTTTVVLYAGRYVELSKMYGSDVTINVRPATVLGD